MAKKRARVRRTDKEWDELSPEEWVAAVKKLMARPRRVHRALRAAELLKVSKPKGVPPYRVSRDGEILDCECD